MDRATPATVAAMNATGAITDTCRAIIAALAHPTDSGPAMNTLTETAAAAEIVPFASRVCRTDTLPLEPI